MIGSHPSASSAVISTFLSPSEAIQIGMVSRSGWSRILSGLPSPRPWSSESGMSKNDVVDSSGSRLRPGADQPDDLAGPAERLVVGHPVEPLDHLRPGGAEAEDRPAGGHVVQPGGGLQDRSRRAREDVEDARGDLEPLGLRGQVAHQRGRVEAVGLGDPDHVEAGLLELGHLVCGVARVAGVLEGVGELHRLIVTVLLSRLQGGCLMSLGPARDRLVGVGRGPRRRCPGSSAAPGRGWPRGWRRTPS